MSSLLLAILACWSLQVSAEAAYAISERWFEQPLNHSSPNGPSFNQQIHILRPSGVSSLATVFFVLGNETDATEEGLVKLYEAYGSPEDMIFIQAEHRGYGQSLGPGEQTKPHYVQVGQALSDFHRVVEHFKPEFPGAWIAAGYSYGGALVINFAYQYPQDVQAILSSSAPIHWPFLIPEYSAQVRKNLGDGLSRRLAEHHEALAPQTLYNDDWRQREIISALIVGLGQRQDTQDLVPYVSMFSYFPTSWFTSILGWVLPEEAFHWADRRVAQKVSEEQARTGDWNWYTWKYQQCSELGTFFVAAPFSYNEADHIEDCRHTFGEEPRYLQAARWDLEDMIGRITVPQVIVSGGKDPWSSIGVKPDHPYRNIDFVYATDGYHCPDRDNPNLGREVMSRLRSQL